METNVPPADVNQCQLRYGRNFREVTLGLVNVTLWLETNYHEVMANRKATMTDIRVIIREFVRGTSLREMERKLKISRTSLRAYRDRAEASGKSMVELLSLEDAEF